MFYSKRYNTFTRRFPTDMDTAEAAEDMKAAIQIELNDAEISEDHRRDLDAAKAQLDRIQSTGLTRTLKFDISLERQQLGLSDLGEKDIDLAMKNASQWGPDAELSDEDDDEWTNAKLKRLEIESDDDLDSEPEQTQVRITSVNTCSRDEERRRCEGLEVLFARSPGHSPSLEYRADSPQATLQQMVHIPRDARDIKIARLEDEIRRLRG